LAVARDGMVVAVWQDHRDGWSQIYLATSSDGGATFGAATPVSSSPLDQWQPAVAIDRSGRKIAVAWSEGVGAGGRKVKIARITRRGRRMLDPDPAAPAGTRQARPALAWVGSRLWIAWQDDRGGDW